MNISTKTKIEKVVGHVVTKDGRHVLIHAEGPNASTLEKLTARWNSRRWNGGKRTWLL